jgi:hypothetical protein
LTANGGTAINNAGHAHSAFGTKPFRAGFTTTNSLTIYVIEATHEEDSFGI